MGSEFLSKAKRPIEKHIDSKRMKLATPDLFTVKPTEMPRRYVVTLTSDAKVSDGEALIVGPKDGKLNMYRGNKVVGSFDNPGDGAISEIERSGGVANGRVERVHKLANKAEVSLC